MSRQAIILSGLICLCVTRCCPSRLTHCDNGKTNLVTDLPGPDELLCKELRPQSQTNRPAIDTKHNIKAADYICMDSAITYNDRIPTHGPYRPVEAESGDYLYCPPQRWLHNLKVKHHHIISITQNSVLEDRCPVEFSFNPNQTHLKQNGALVFLYHPCVSAEARRSLAGLAHSCLSHYILTPHPWLSQHRPLAVVSWGRSLEMSRITTGVCDWLFTISSNISQANTSRRAKYNLYLTKPAPLDKPENTSQEMSKEERLKFLKNCCMETLTEVQRTRKSRMVVKPVLKEVEQKDAIKPEELNTTESAKLNHKDTLLQNHTKEMSYFSVLTVTQSLSSAKDSKSKTPEKLFPQSNMTERHKYQTNRKTHEKTKTEGKKHRIKTDTKAQRTGSECGELGQCGVPDSSKSPHLGGPLRGERIPIQRTDEAVWAAGALGFLLVLLTLSVLHTRLYRHWRASSSLYWRDNQQDYDSVGDIIRRRLRMVGRRKRRSSHNRRQECPLLSDTSNEENSD